MRSRELIARAGERTRVVDRRSGSVPRRYVITVEAEDGAPVGGTIVVQGSRWLFRSDPEEIPIAPEVVVVKGFWDTLFRVDVVPDRDAVVVVR